MSSEGRFAGKTAIIVGAADGIGRASARIIAAEGGTVIGVDLNAEALNKAMDDINSSAAQSTDAQSNRIRAVAFPGNALDEVEVSGLIASILADHRQIDILVNCVGGSTIIGNPAATIEDMSLAEWTGILEFNLTGTFLFIKGLLPTMKAQGSGKIVNLSSIAGRGLSDASSSSYAAAKGGIIALTRKLSLELGPHGINVNAVAPGRTLSDRIKSRWDLLSDEEKAVHLESVPLRKISEPEDQARVICFLASRDADMVTGVTIDVNGGVR